MTPFPVFHASPSIPVIPCGRVSISDNTKGVAHPSHGHRPWFGFPSFTSLKGLGNIDLRKPFKVVLSVPSHQVRCPLWGG